MDNPIITMYENYNEESRLTTNQARKVEFLITQKIFKEIFPANAKVLDCAREPEYMHLI